MEVGEVEAQAVARGRSQGPAQLLVVGVPPREARRRQAPEHGLWPLRAPGGSCRGPEQAQEDQQPGGGAVHRRVVRVWGPVATPHPCEGGCRGLPPTSWCAVQLARPGLDSQSHL